MHPPTLEIYQAAVGAGRGLTLQTTTTSMKQARTVFLTAKLLGSNLHSQPTIAIEHSDHSNTGLVASLGLNWL